MRGAPDRARVGEMKKTQRGGGRVKVKGRQESCTDQERHLRITTGERRKIRGQRKKGLEGKSRRRKFSKGN